MRDCIEGNKLHIWEVGIILLSKLLFIYKPQFWQIGQYLVFPKLMFIYGVDRYRWIFGWLGIFWSIWRAIIGICLNILFRSDPYKRWSVKWIQTNLALAANDFNFRNLKLYVDYTNGNISIGKRLYWNHFFIIVRKFWKYLEQSECFWKVDLKIIEFFVKTIMMIN